MPDIRSLASSIMTGKSGTDVISMDDFKKLYRFLERSIQEQNGKLGETYILLLTEQALVRFQINQNFILRVTDNKRALNKKDFDVVLTPRFEGNTKPIPLRAFIWTEIVQNWWILFPISIIFFFLFSHDQTNSNLQTINQMLVEANALFIGIFVLFTITQNRELLASRELVKNGLTHQLMQNDNYITHLAIISLLSAFISAALLCTVSEPFLEKLIITQSIIIDPLIWSRGFTSFSLVLLIDCFLAVTRYYLRIMRTALEGTMYLDMMGNKAEKKE